MDARARREHTWVALSTRGSQAPRGTQAPRVCKATRLTAQHRALCRQPGHGSAPGVEEAWRVAGGPEPCVSLRVCRGIQGVRTGAPYPLGCPPPQEHPSSQGHPPGLSPSPGVSPTAGCPTSLGHHTPPRLSPFSPETPHPGGNPIPQSISTPWVSPYPLGPHFPQSFSRLSVLLTFTNKPLRIQQGLFGLPLTWLPPDGACNGLSIPAPLFSSLSSQTVSPLRAGTVPLCLCYLLLYLQCPM